MLRIPALLREPLLHFFVLGAAVFVLFDVVGDRDEVRADEIVVSAGEIDRLVAGWKKTRMRPPTADELQGLIGDRIREEVYYREALAMGLDRDDVIVRRRLRQKIEFLLDDIAAVEPTQQELEVFLAENASSFQRAPIISFRHVYFEQDERPGEGRSAALRLLAELDGSDDGVDTTALGDPFPLARDYASLRERELANLFGRDFAAQLWTLEAGTWQGPVASGYGLHLVFIRERTEPELPELAEVRDAVAREWGRVRRLASNEELYGRLRERYRVVVERPAWLDPELAAVGAL